MNNKLFINFGFLCIVSLFKPLSASKLPCWSDLEYVYLKKNVSTRSFPEKGKTLISMCNNRRFVDIIDLFGDASHDRFGASEEEAKFRVLRSIVLSKAHQELARDVAISPSLSRLKLNDALSALSEYVKFEIATRFAHHHPRQATLYSALINAGYAQVFDTQLSFEAQRFTMREKIDWQRFFAVLKYMHHHTTLAAQQCKNYERLCEQDAESGINLSIVQNATRSVKLLSDRVQAFVLVLLSNIRVAPGLQ